MAIEFQSPHPTPAQNSALKRATSDPIGSVADALSELGKIESRARDLHATANRASADFESDTRMPEGTPEELLDPVREAAEAKTGPLERDARRELNLLQTRARAIKAQLEAAAQEPSLTNVRADILDGSARYLPLVESQLSGIDLAGIQRRISAARIRDDEAECLALAIALGPILATWKADPDSGDAWPLWDVKDQLRELSARWRDRSLDLALDKASAVDRTVDEASRAIVNNFTTRTGKTEYGYEGWLAELPT